MSIAAIARSYVGTPWRHQGRLPGVGLDCIGLVVCAAREAGYQIKDSTDYSRQPNPRQLLSAIGGHCHQVSSLDLCMPGDLLLFKVDTVPKHTGIITQQQDGHFYFVHSFMRGRADGTDGAVVEVILDRFWQKRIHSIWRLA